MSPVNLSIVMPSLNSARYIDAAIQSVLDQGFDDLELVIQDGGSSDGTADVVRSFHDPRISWTSESDKGQADALNRAVRRSSGDWILWLNSDDMLAAGALEEIVSHLDSARSSIVHGDFGIIDEEGRIVKTYVCAPMTFGRLLARGAYVFSASVFVRRNLASQVGTFDERLHFCMDYDWLLRLSKAGGVDYKPGLVAFLRDHADTKSRRHPWDFWREQWTVRRSHGASLPNAILVQLEMGATFVARPLLRSRFWRAFRPAKTLGNRRFRRWTT